MRDARTLSSEGGSSKAMDPGFLQQLDDKPTAALESFYAYATRFLGTRPPRELRMLSPEDREDVVQEFIVHCSQADFRVLRSYQPGRVPFSAWFYYIARNHTIDWGNKQRRRLAREHPEPDSFDEWYPAGDPGPERELAARELWKAVEQRLSRLGGRCRALLLGAAEGLKPRELVRLVGCTESENKRVSDDLRYCRRKLIDALVQDGFVPTEHGLKRGGSR